MQKKIIGIPTNLIYLPTSSFNKEVVALNADFYHAIHLAGGTPICLPPVTSKEEIIAQINLCDGLLLPGGDDINPLLYDEEPSFHIGDSNTLVDTHQLLLTQYALTAQLSILGICRGHQLLNVVLGGNVYQDISEYDKPYLGHMQTARREDLCHSIDILPNTTLYTLLGSSLHVNSFHHQIIKDLGENVIATAFSKDGVIEAIEVKDYPFAIGIQCHPEIMLQSSSSVLPLFRAFVDSCNSSH